MDKFAELKALLGEVGGVDSFSTEAAIRVMHKVIDVLRGMGLSENSAYGLLEGYKELFGLEFINMPDFTDGRYVLTPNHVSEFDGPLFGALHPNMLIMAKKEWTDDQTLGAFLGQFFKFVGVDRKDKLSGTFAIGKCIKHIKNSTNSAVTIFVQQTIADIDIIQPEDIAAGAYFVRKKAGASILPVFCEQVSLSAPTRIVFGEPLEPPAPEDFGKKWLEAQLSMQKSLNPPARKPQLNKKHSIPISQRDF